MYSSFISIVTDKIRLIFFCQTTAMSTYYFAINVLDINYPVYKQVVLIFNQYVKRFYAQWILGTKEL